MKNSESRVVSIIREIAAEENMTLESFSSDWAFRLTKNGRSVFIVGYQFPLNPAAAKEICQDKVLTSEVLEADGVPVCVHEFLPDPGLTVYTGAPDAAETAGKALEKYGTVVIKDNFGTGGNRVFRVGTKEQARQALKEIFSGSTAACLSPFYEILEEYRAVMLDGEVKIVIRKERMSVTGDGIHSVQELAQAEPEKAAYAAVLPERERSFVPALNEKTYLNWKHNLGQGARGYRVTDPDAVRRVSALAARAVKSTGIRFASVDVIDTVQGLMVLEINGGVMLEHFASQSEDNYRDAHDIYRAALLKGLD